MNGHIEITLWIAVDVTCIIYYNKYYITKNFISYFEHNSTRKNT